MDEQLKCEQTLAQVYDLRYEFVTPAPTVRVACDFKGVFGRGEEARWQGVVPVKEREEGGA